MGGRTTKKDGLYDCNSGLLRCPRCSSRMLSTVGELLPDETRTLYIPRPNKDFTPGGTDEFTWESKDYTQWWQIPDIDCFDNVGMSKPVTNPAGETVEIVLCSECGAGPLGYRVAGSPPLFLPCDLLVQQDATLADDKEDFKAPENANLEQLKAMMQDGNLTTQFKVVFGDDRLGMMLNDALDGVGVEVQAFTVTEDGELGAAEKGEEVKVGDKIVRVANVSTAGKNYEGVLDMVCGASRPLEIFFERSPKNKAGDRGEVQRVAHRQWDGKED
ncbi:hypothetical protein TL16_g10544 [Triparma laevis f. inornata]|uniref:PDZ domain-containing protein n=1 Tax=Triparma laevis f. inornata TaxID=1714386 RepID=A0A9W7B8Y1_9STRA|nr:hypothetical protein TL16_g10544 [Triparma laevis f. inornata]